MKAQRPIVGCINWNQPVGIPRAVSYVLRDGENEAHATVYHATWDQALRRANELAARFATRGLLRAPHRPVDDGEDEPLYDLDTRNWSKECPCIAAMQVDPECRWHGRHESRYRPVDDNPKET